MTKIFISHSSQDAGFVQELAHLLVKLGFDVWIDLTGIRWNWQLRPAIQTALDQCEVMIFVVSPEGITHPYIEGEWQQYLDTGKRVIPVIWRLADVPLSLQREHYADFQGGDFKAALTLLLTELGKSDKSAVEGELHVIRVEKLTPGAVQVETATSPPANRMERFTQRARHILTLAQEAATQYQHGAISTQHMLLAMIREGSGVASRVLHELGVSQARVEAMIGAQKPASSGAMTDQPQLTDEAKRMLELAVDEARRMGHVYLGTEHLLLGLARMTDSSAIHILKRLNVTPTDIRNAVRRVLQENPSWRDDTSNPPDDKPQPPPEGNSPQE